MKKCKRVYFQIFPDNRQTRVIHKVCCWKKELFSLLDMKYQLFAYGRKITEKDLHGPKELRKMRNDDIKDMKCPPKILEPELYLFNQACRKKYKIVPTNKKKGQEVIETQYQRIHEPFEKSFSFPYTKIMDYYTAVDAVNRNKIRVFQKKGDVQLPVLGRVITNLRNYSAGSTIVSATVIYAIKYIEGEERKQYYLCLEIVDW